MNILNKFKVRVSKYGLKYVINVIIQNKIYRHLDDFIMSLFTPIFKVISLKNTILIESHNDFDCNGGAFYDYLLEHEYNNKYKIVWLLRNKKPRNLPSNVLAFNIFKPNIRKAYYICTAKYMTADHVIIKKVRNEQKSFYLTHGSISLKNTAGKILLPSMLDYCLAPSEFMKSITAKQTSLEYPCSKLIVLGYPMHDILYNNAKGDLSKITENSYKKVILWMPTFRQNISWNRNDSGLEENVGIPLLNNQNEYLSLNEQLKKNNSLLIIKIHPMQDLNELKIGNETNIKILTASEVKKLNIDNYRLMKETDALISDYSSAAFDYLHCNKPIGYILSDEESYKLGFIVEDPHSMMAGHMIYTFGDLTKFIEDVIDNNDIYVKDRICLFNKVFYYHDGNSCKRLVDFMGL